VKKGGFVEAVTKAINQREPSDCWEGEYYCCDNFNPKKANVYMHTRRSALGPGWSESVLVGLRVEHKIPYA